MKRVLVLLLFATSALAQVQRVADDALVIDRVAEASKRDLPADLLKRIVSEDIELLRGKRPDGTYEHATYERLEASRTSTSFSVQPRSDKMQTLEMRGAFVYRVVLDVPSRRLVVRKNRPVWVERVDFEYVGVGSPQTERSSVEVKAWIQIGEVKPVDLPAVARQATIRVIATADPKTGYGNLDVTLVHAKIVDNADSPYASAVASAKAIQRALENNDIASIRASAKRMGEALSGGQAILPVVPTGEIARPPLDRASELELQTELQVIEDLLTGTEAERREGLDKLHQLIRRMRR
ncbi:MAG TPA: hypothetical protein VNA69_03010 [Thermoanaerobaculia bacterium]|nr:hypothetical protein [Thermoanaerobaculia bacterium]